MSKESVVEDIGSRIRLLVIALIILAVVLTAYMFVECALLVYSVYKKKPVHSDPDSVVVKDSKKGSKKSKKSRRKSSKSSKSSSKKRSDKAKSKRTPGKRRRSSKSSAPLPLQAKKQFKSAEKSVEPAKCKKASTPAAKSAIPPPSMNVPKTFEGIHPDEFSAGTSTDKLNARISPQFENTKACNDTFSTGTPTEQINVCVPPQFDTSNLPSTILHPTPEFVREVAEQVVEYLEARKTVSSGVPQDKYGYLETPKRDVRQVPQPIMPPANTTTTPTATPPQQSTPLSDNRSLEQQLASPPKNVKEPVDSLFIMDYSVGPNGEVNKVRIPPPKNSPMNSLMLGLESRNAVPIDGRPVEAQNPGAQPGAQSGTAKGAGTQL